jgi:hypothetical protein
VKQIKFRTIFTILLLILLVVAPRINETEAWGGTSHYYIAVVGTLYLENVITGLGDNGERWLELFQVYESDLKLGSVAPDRVFRDFINHIYHIKGPSTHQNGPNKVSEWYNSFKNHLLAENYSGAVWAAGVMSHYLADLCQPMHTDEVWKEDDGSENGGISGHFKYESDVNAYIDSITFRNHTPMLLENTIKATAIDCAYFSNGYHDEVVETYWNGSFWTPKIIEITTELLNYAATTFANIIYTAIMEVNVTPPDFTDKAINVEVTIPTQIYQGTSYIGNITVSDWQGSPLDASVLITRTWFQYNIGDNGTSEEEDGSLGPFIVPVSREKEGFYSFELNIAVNGTIELKITVEKLGMISKTESLEITVLSDSSSLTTSLPTNNMTSSAPVFYPFIFLTSVVLMRRFRNKRNQ